MDRSRTSQTECPPAMRVIGPESSCSLWRAKDRKRGQLGPDATYRRAVSKNSVLRFTAHGRGVGDQISAAEPQARAAINAANGHYRDLSQTANDQPGQKSQNLPLFAAKC